MSNFVRTTARALLVLFTFALCACTAPHQFLSLSSPTGRWQLRVTARPSGVFLVEDHFLVESRTGNHEWQTVFDSGAQDWNVEYLFARWDSANDQALLALCFDGAVQARLYRVGLGTWTAEPNAGPLEGVSCSDPKPSQWILASRH